MMVGIIVRLQFIFKFTNKLTLLRLVHEPSPIEQHGRVHNVILQQIVGAVTSIPSDFD